MWLKLWLPLLLRLLRLLQLSVLLLLLLLYLRLLGHVAQLQLLQLLLLLLLELLQLPLLLDQQLSCLFLLLLQLSLLLLPGLFYGLALLDSVHLLHDARDVIGTWLGFRISSADASTGVVVAAGGGVDERKRTSALFFPWHWYSGHHGPAAQIDHWSFSTLCFEIHQIMTQEMGWSV